MNDFKSFLFFQRKLQHVRSGSHCPEHSLFPQLTNNGTTSYNFQETRQALWAQLISSIHFLLEDSTKILSYNSFLRNIKLLKTPEQTLFSTWKKNHMEDEQNYLNQTPVLSLQNCKLRQNAEAIVKVKDPFIFRLLLPLACKKMKQAAERKEKFWVFNLYACQSLHLYKTPHRSQ